MPSRQEAHLPRVHPGACRGRLQRALVFFGLLTILAAPLLHAEAAPPDRISLDRPVERPLSGGEAHEYILDLTRGEYVRCVLRQQGIDLEGILKSPAGETLIEIDGPTGRSDLETISYVAPESGSYSIEVRAFAGEPPGRYRIEVAELRPATPEDRLRVEAEWTFALGYRHEARRTPEGFSHAIDQYQTALEKWHLAGDAFGEAGARQRIALLLVRQGKPKEALPFLQSALPLYQENGGNMAKAAEVQNRLGEALSLLGRNQEALDAQARALGMFQQIGDRRQAAIVLTYLAGNQDVSGRLLDARGSYAGALQIAREISEPGIEAAALNGLATIERRLGLPHEALEHLTAALSLFRRLRNTAAEAAALNNLGSLLVDLNAPEAAREVLLQALPLQSSSRNRTLAMISLGWVALGQGQLQEARELLQRSLTLARESEDREAEALSLEALGALHLDASEPGAAEAVLVSAVRIFREQGNLPRTASTEALLGRARAAQGSTQAARESLTEALALTGRIGRSSAQAEILVELARLERDRDLAAARRHAEASIERYEQLQARIPGETLRISHFASIHEAYGLYVDLLMLQHKAHPGEGFEAKALEVAERSRSRGLLEFLEQARIDLREGDPALLQQEESLRLELNGLADRRSKLSLEKDPEQVEEIQKRLEAVSSELQILEARLQAGSARYGALKKPGIRASEIQALLGNETVLLAYALGEPRSYLWLVTAGSVSSFELPDREEIETLVRRAHEDLARPSGQGAAREREDLARLSQILLGPVLDRLDGQRLAIVPDGALRFLPFSALPVPADGAMPVPLLLEHEVVLLPSFSVLREIRRFETRRDKARATLAILADPVYQSDDPRLQNASKALAPATPHVSADPVADALRSLQQPDRAGGLDRLTWSRREAEQIAAAAEGRQVLLALDFEASRDLATSPRLSGYRILHFATHGILDTRHPQLSGLALSQVDEQGRPREGFLRLHDIYQMRLSADLAVLSGCETALGKNLRGEGIIGLTHGFFHAGASQVLASLWPVRDRATAELMQRFYRGMLREGLPPSAALRQAQIEMWRERTWRDPFYWAAFVLQGDWQAGADFSPAVR